MGEEEYIKWTKVTIDELKALQRQMQIESLEIYIYGNWKIPTLCT